MRVPSDAFDEAHGREQVRVAERGGVAHVPADRAGAVAAENGGQPCRDVGHRLVPGDLFEPVWPAPQWDGDPVGVVDHLGERDALLAGEARRQRMVLVGAERDQSPVVDRRDHAAQRLADPAERRPLLDARCHVDYDTVRVTVAQRFVPLQRARDERRRHHRCWPAPVRPVRRQVSDGNGRRRDFRGGRRRRRRMEGRSVRHRRQLDGGQPGRDRRHGGPVGHPVHQRLQRLRHRRQRRQGLRGRHSARRLRHRHRHRPGQAPPRRVHRGPRAGGDAELVRRERSVPHHPVLRHESQPLPARPRYLSGNPRQGRRQELPQRCTQPECVPAQADPRGSKSSTRRC